MLDYPGVLRNRTRSLDLENVLMQLGGKSLCISMFFNQELKKKF